MERQLSEEERLAREAAPRAVRYNKSLLDAEIYKLRAMFAEAEDPQFAQQWTKAELEDWCRSWCRTPHTTLKAFIDAGFCSDEAPSREEMRLLRQPAPSTVDATKAVMSNDTRSVIQGLLKYCDPIGVHGDHFRAKALELLQRPDAPTDGRCVWYRGWECFPDGEGRAGQNTGWVAYLGGPDADCITVDALTWTELLDEIDDHDMTEAGQ